MEISAIILAGGKSRRMGEDKALLEVNGKSMLERAIALCKTITSEIIISSNHSSHNKFGYLVMPDEIKECGPMGGIAACLKISKNEWNLVLSVDSAFVEPDFVLYLISEADNFDAVVPYSEKGKEPLIALYNKTALPSIEENLNAGKFKMIDLLTSINTKLVDAQQWVKKFPKLFNNLNRPEDL